ncbi:hypothetical protein [Microbacterium sp. 77mftsu3.1]|uniref:hypothetical protein n=1 Tax=Microbacterium sp. 77mftsu3.1 TaxID=1761802 RepID=UPI00035F9E44|nr:hypothetical protein [Microbacterium sp. 77mftsu3.1]SDH39752.1 hypothetical protein SAMN04488590_3234 [Microbacterium sp. 77mftsu3.1]
MALTRKTKPAKGKKQAAPEPDATTDEPQDDLLRVNEATPAHTIHESRSRRRRVLVWVFIIIGFGSMFSALSAATAPPEPPVKPVGSTDVNSSVGKSVAHTKMTAWLSAKPGPLPGGYIVSWDGFTRIAGGGKAESSSDSPANDAELHRFTLASDVNGVPLFYDATVLVSVSDSLGAIASAEPSLLPRVPSSSQGWSGELWPKYSTTPASDAVSSTALQWAKAFTDSGDALRLYVGDENPTHAYMPLQGARIRQATVPAAGFIKVDGEEEPKTVIARVELVIAWSDNTQNEGSRTQYDVLIEQAHTASPKIVAWGPAGTGPTLKKYGNAVPGTQISPANPDSVPTEPEPEDGEN